MVVEGRVIGSEQEKRCNKATFLMVGWLLFTFRIDGGLCDGGTAVISFEDEVQRATLQQCCSCTATAQHCNRATLQHCNRATIPHIARNGPFLPAIPASYTNCLLHIYPPCHATPF